MELGIKLHLHLRLAGQHLLQETISIGNNLYISIATLSSSTDSATYSNIIEVPRGPKGDAGSTGPAGPASTEPGPAGSGFRMIFHESSSEPTLPTGGSWDGRTFRPPTNWSVNSPNRTPKRS